PPFSIIALRRLDAGSAAIRRNLCLLGACALGAATIIFLTDAMLLPAKRAIIVNIAGVGLTTNMAQWVAVAIGIYATGSWMQTIWLRDPVAA
ncbi:hypothetical protein ACI3PF_20405, partial [Lactococcus lactis]